LSLAHRESFQRFCEYVCPSAAGTFLDSWTTGAIGSHLDPMKKVARSLRRHRELILN
jgi:hypothetical protein